MKADTKMLDRILDEHNCDKLKMIAIMQDIQKETRYLPKEALTYVAGRLGVSRSDTVSYTHLTLPTICSV